MRALLALFLAAAVAHAADPFAPKGTKGILTVDYVYESSGSKSSNGGYDPYAWKVKRTLSMTADLVAQAPLDMPTLQAMDAAQVAELKGKGEKARAIMAPSAPMIADMEKMVARCKEDEACISREVQKMGLAMGSNNVEAARKSANEFTAMAAPGAPRYQSWRATGQKGTYAIEEHVQISNADPICTSKPRHRCSREETRRGSGAVPLPDAGPRGRSPAAVAGIGAVEMDNAKGTLTVMPPVPLAALPYTETITSDEPDGTYETPIPRGSRQQQAFFRVSASGSGYQPVPFVVPLKGGWRDQAGEQIVKLQGKYGETGTLTVRWRFKAQ